MHHLVDRALDSTSPLDRPLFSHWCNLCSEAFSKTRMSTLSLSLLTILALSLSCVAAQEPTAHWPTGSDSCSCINPWSAPHNLQVNTDAPASTSSTCAIARSSDSHCFPNTYGVPGGEGKCSRADWTLTPECGQLSDVQKPDWCHSMWCFVDPSNCTRKNVASSFFQNARFTASDGTSKPMTYSYQTCGYVDTYSLDPAAELQASAAANPSVSFGCLCSQHGSQVGAWAGALSPAPTIT